MSSKGFRSKLTWLVALIALMALFVAACGGDDDDDSGGGATFSDAGYKTAGIDHVECFTYPLRYAVLTITRYTARIIYDSFALLEQPVKECAFPDIRATYYSDCK